MTWADVRYKPSRGQSSLKSHLGMFEKATQVIEILSSVVHLLTQWLNNEGPLSSQWVYFKGTSSYLVAGMVCTNDW